MSILLDALKKAALEKQRRDQSDTSQTNLAANSNSVHHTPITLVSSHPGETDNNKSNPEIPSGDISVPIPSKSNLDVDDNQSYSQVENKLLEDETVKDMDFVLDVDFETLENIGEDPSGDRSSSEDDDSEEELDELARQFVEEERTTKQLSETNQPQNDILDIEKHESDNLPARKPGESMDVVRDDSHQDEKPDETNSECPPKESNQESLDLDEADAEKEVIITENESSGVISGNDQSLDDGDSSRLSDLTLENTAENMLVETSTILKQEESFEQLLQKNRLEDRKKKRKFLILYSLLAFSFLLAVVLYFFSVYFTGKESLVGSLSANFDISKVSTIALSSEEKNTALDVGVGDIGLGDGAALATDMLGASNISIDDRLNTTSKNHRLPELLNKEAISESSPKNNSAIKISDNRDSEKLVKSKAKISPTSPAVASSESNASRLDEKKTQPVTKADNNRKLTQRNKDNQNLVSRGVSSVSYLDAAIADAFTAYSNANYNVAQKRYADAIVIDPYSRDALLGSAAVAVAQERYDDALLFYQRRLNRAPKDTYAHAGILSIATGGNSSAELFSSINSMLKEYPNAAHLYFLKGTILSRDSKWHAAQDAFFNAWRRDEMRRDYAYNLAIALDHLGQRKEALRFYRLVINASGILARGISLDAVKQRITTLEKTL